MAPSGSLGPSEPLKDSRRGLRELRNQSGTTGPYRERDRADRYSERGTACEAAGNRKEMPSPPDINVGNRDPDATEMMQPPSLRPPTAPRIRLVPRVWPQRVDSFSESSSCRAVRALCPGAPPNRPIFALDEGSKNIRKSRLSLFCLLYEIFLQSAGRDRWNSRQIATRWKTVGPTP